MTRRWIEFPGEEARAEVRRARAELYGDSSGFVKSTLRKVMIESGGWMSRFVRSNVWQNLVGVSDDPARRGPAVSESLAKSVSVKSATEFRAIKTVASEMFWIFLRLYYCKESVAHLLNLCLPQAGQVSRTSKQFSSSLLQRWLARLSPCLLQAPGALCPTVPERRRHGLDGLGRVLLRRNSAVALQHSPSYHSPQPALKCLVVGQRGRQVDHQEWEFLWMSSGAHREVKGGGQAGQERRQVKLEGMLCPGRETGLTTRLHCASEMTLITDL